METAHAMNDLLSSLNSAQREAATILEGAALVIAGAGSGKTKVVTCRILQLIDAGINPSSILGLTFTKKAAGEIEKYFASLAICPLLSDRLPLRKSDTRDCPPNIGASSTCVRLLASISAPSVSTGESVTHLNRLDS